MIVPFHLFVYGDGSTQGSSLKYKELIDAYPSSPSRPVTDVAKFADRWCSTGGAEELSYFQVTSLQFSLQVR